MSELVSHIRLRESEKKSLLFCIRKAREQATSQLFFEPRRVISRVIELGTIEVIKEIKAEYEAKEKQGD